MIVLMATGNTPIMDGIFSRDAYLSRQYRRRDAGIQKLGSTHYRIIFSGFRVVYFYLCLLTPWRKLSDNV